MAWFRQFESHLMKKTMLHRMVRLAAGGKGVAIALVIGMLGRADAQLSQKDFQEPPLEARPGALWSWLNGDVDLKQITHELEEMKAKGMRGALIWDLGSIADPDKIIPEGPEFLGEESLKAIHHAIDEAGRLGLELGLFASSSWNAGGPWVKPEDGAMQLLSSEVLVEGPKDFTGKLPLPEKIREPWTPIAVVAVPHVEGEQACEVGKVQDLSRMMAADGTLSWKVPAGKWKLLCFLQSATGQKLMCPSPKSHGLMIDHLSARATQANLDDMISRLLKGRKDFGALKVWMYDSYEVRDANDWTPVFRSEFQSAYGYDPAPWLPVLAGHVIGSPDQSKRFSHDYHKLVSDLIIRNHFALSRDVVNRYGLKLLAEAGHGGHARVDPLKALGAADIPMGEYWNHRKNWVTKEASSAANIYGQRLVNSESMTGWQFWQDGPANYKRVTDVAFCAGLNQVTFHTFAHNPPHAGLPGHAYHAGEHFNVNNTWWNESGPMLADMARTSYMLQQGRFVADVCAYYGDHAPNLVPARRLTPTVAAPYPEGTCQHCGRPEPVDLSTLGHAHDYDYLNEEVLVGRMQVENGHLVLPSGMRYQLMVLPEREEISPLVLAKIAVLVRDGATVVGPKPSRANTLKGYPACDDEVRRLADEVWGKVDGRSVQEHRYGKGRVIWGRPLKQVLESLAVKPDFEVVGVENANREIDYVHRVTDSEDIYFVANTTLESRELVSRFRPQVGMVPSFWNPEDGSVTACPWYRQLDGLVEVPLRLPAASSVFVVFRKGEGPHLTQVAWMDANGAPSASVLDTLAWSGVENGKAHAHAGRNGQLQWTRSDGVSGRLEVKGLLNQVIDGSWSLRFPAGRGAPAEVDLDSLIDWTQHPDPGVKYFSGTAVYSKAFDLDAGMLASPSGADGQRPKILLNLGTMREVASVKVNGQDAGILWKQPLEADITRLLKPGSNRLEIAVTNLWNNRIVGDVQRDDDQDITRTNLKFKFKKNSPLLPSGLLGPVSLRQVLPVQIELSKN